MKGEAVVVKEILVYVLLGFGVIVAIVGVILYFRMYKQMFHEHKQANDDTMTASLTSETYDKK